MSKKYLYVRVEENLIAYLKERSKAEQKFLPLIVEEMIRRDKEQHDNIEKQAFHHCKGGDCA